MTKKKTIEVHKIINLTKHQAKQILDMLDDLKYINGQTDEKCPIDYDMICKLEGMEFKLANIVDATVECEHGHYSRWGGAYEFKN
jgi:hypothetical protein